AVAWIASAGVALDRGAWRSLAEQAEAERDRLREQLNDTAPRLRGNLFEGVSWRSQREVLALFAQLGFPLERADDQAPATVDHPLADLLRRFRAADKLSGTYGRDWLKHVRGDGRVYAQWRQIGREESAIASGRMTCTSPNLQQVPRDPRFRRCLIAPP